MYHSEFIQPPKDDKFELFLIFFSIINNSVMNLLVDFFFLDIFGTVSPWSFVVLVITHIFGVVFTNLFCVCVSFFFFFYLPCFLFFVSIHLSLLHCLEVNIRFLLVGWLIITTLDLKGFDLINSLTFLFSNYTGNSECFNS